MFLNISHVCCVIHGFIDSFSHASQRHCQVMVGRSHERFFRGWQPTARRFWFLSVSRYFSRSTLCALLIASSLRCLPQGTDIEPDRRVRERTGKQGPSVFSAARPSSSWWLSPPSAVSALPRSHEAAPVSVCVCVCCVCCVGGSGEGVCVKKMTTRKAG